MKIKITRTVNIPAKVQIARYEKAPELGPKILFFSGGTAIKRLCGELINYTHNSIHIITPFDLGGSSAKLRLAFDMPAIGDVRNRLMALADKSFHGNPEVRDLFSHRFSKSKSKKTLVNDLVKMTKGNHPLVAKIPDPIRKIIRNHRNKTGAHSFVCCVRSADPFVFNSPGNQGREESHPQWQPEKGKSSRSGP